MPLFCRRYATCTLPIMVTAARFRSLSRVTDLRRTAFKRRQHGGSEEPGIGTGPCWDHQGLTRRERLVGGRFRKTVDVTQAAKFLEHARRKQIPSAHNAP